MFVGLACLEIMLVFNVSDKRFDETLSYLPWEQAPLISSILYPVSFNRRPTFRNARYERLWLKKFSKQDGQT